ncbi:putative PTS system fructose-like transporter subunit EIIB [Yersinia pseudotuberculosis]|nr:putative PTS system fructose-like transporter subunit EIIB [Yersinia pseudotuberculosis]
MTNIIAITACPSGVAHTYMAAEALERAAKAKGWECKVETQGSIGVENKLTAEDVAAADMVILTKDIGILFEERFAGKVIVRIAVSDAVKRADAIMDKIAAYLEKNTNPCAASDINTVEAAKKSGLFGDEAGDQIRRGHDN